MRDEVPVHEGEVVAVLLGDDRYHQAVGNVQAGREGIHAALNFEPPVQ